MNPWFVTGYIAAQGSFSFSRYDKTFILSFVVQAKSRDRTSLDEVRVYFENIGSLYERRSSILWRVSKANELQKIVSHFDQYPLEGHKGQIYNIWKQMVFAKREYRKPDSDKLTQLSQELTRLRQ